MDAVHHGHRLRPSPGAAARRVRGVVGGWRGRIAQTLRQITLPLLAPAIVFAAVFRAIDAFRSFDVVFGLTYGGPGRLTTTLSFYAWENGLHLHALRLRVGARLRDGRRRDRSRHAAARASLGAPAGGRHVIAPPDRAGARLRAAGGHRHHRARALRRHRCSSPRRRASTSSRSRRRWSFDIDQIVENYRDVLITRGFLGYTWNSIVVTDGHRRRCRWSSATPAAYAFSRHPVPRAR